MEEINEVTSTAISQKSNQVTKITKFYKAASITALAIGILSITAGLLSKFGPHIFYNNADFFPIVGYQIGYGIVAIVFFLFSLIAKNFIAKIIWWIYFAGLCFAFLTLLDTDPFNIQKMISRANTPKNINVEFVTETKDEDGNILRKTEGLGTQTNVDDATPQVVTPVNIE